MSEMLNRIDRLYDPIASLFSNFYFCRTEKSSSYIVANYCVILQYISLINMKAHILIFIFSVLSINLHAQAMNNDKLNGIIYTLSDTVQGENGSWQFIIDELAFICITDQIHNRMRIISPIAELAEVTDEELLRCMEANFHSALDARYAISDGILWAAFIHPLRELTKDQVISAITQVYSTAQTFGTYYSSGELSFPTSGEQDVQQN